MQNQNIDQLLTSWQRSLQHNRQQSASDPQHNPVTGLALRITQGLDRQSIGVLDLARIVNILSARLLERLAHDQCQRLLPENNAVDLAQLVGITEANKLNKPNIQNYPELIATISQNYAQQHSLTAPGQIATHSDSWNSFIACWSRPVAAAVFTAHPTFALSPRQNQALCERTRDLLAATGIKSASQGSDDQLLKQQAVVDELTTAPDLATEHDRVLAAIANLRQERRQLITAIYEYAQQNYPNQWQQLLPQPLALATWVGYDLDGRTDIGWQISISFRLQEKAVCLQQLAADLQQICAATSTGNSQLHQPTITACNRLATRLQDNGKQLLRLANDLLQPLSNKQLAATLNQLTSRQQLRDPQQLVATLQQYAQDIGDPELQQQILVLASELACDGFGLAEIHLRINAVQLRNAVREQFGERLDQDDKLQSRRTHLQKLNAIISATSGQKVNFASLLQEHATARRQMMMAAQISKHIDCRTPIRLLIAECESPATLLSALYLARLYGIEHQLDITPLFETPQALQRGATVIERSLTCSSWRSYLKQRQRICVQTGFSDAGRFIGQVTATLAIERLQIKIAQAVKRALQHHLEVVIFNTSGESLGRGGFPGSITAKQLYLFSSFARTTFVAAGNAIRHEFSLQGGDGYRYFQDKSLVAAWLQAIMLTESQTAQTRHRLKDSLYQETDYSLDFFLTLRQWHEDLFHNPDYSDLLDAYGSNLLIGAGSRKSKRQSELASKRHDPSKLRAIPHNAILQQMGYQANVCGGFGTAALFDLDSFQAMLKHSPRTQQLLKLVTVARKNSSLNTVLAFATPLDAAFWMQRAYITRDAVMRKAFRRIARHLADDTRSAAIRRIATHLRSDLLNLEIALSAISKRKIRLTPGKDERVELDVLNAIRISLINQVITHVAMLPTFSDREQLSPEQMMQAAVQMDIDQICVIADKVFPLSAPGESLPLLNESASELAVTGADYGSLHTRYIEPIREFGKLFNRIGVATSLWFGAHG